MYNFILQISLMASLGIMIYLVARGVSRVSDTIDEGIQNNHKNVFDKFVDLLPLEKIDLMISEYFEKILRKIKLVLMKWDNIVTNYLDKIKKTNGNGKNNGEKKPSLFSEDSTSKEEGSSKTD
ncbi:MAG TPA: hypothetical protein ENH26_03280 [Candidatus Wolfebacteria bacterium]|nr:hypothetical protein [Candidatus Wolfebacteria bacterium]